MSVRETINRNSTTVATVALAVLILALATTAWQLHANKEHVPDKVFFTVDDGKTYFADNSKLVPPFDHDGREAVQCYVYRCGKREFVGYLMKYRPDGKKNIEQSYAAGRPFPTVSTSEILVKKPGDPQWIDQDNPKSRDLTRMKCPDDPSDNIELVNP